MGAHWKWLSHSAAAHAEAFIQTWLEAHPELSITLQTLSTGVPEINHRLNVHLCTLHSPITSKNRRGLGISSFGKKNNAGKHVQNPSIFMKCFYFVDEEWGKRPSISVDSQGRLWAMSDGSLVRPSALFYLTGLTEILLLLFSVIKFCDRIKDKSSWVLHQ